MTADMSNPKNWIIIGGFWVFAMLFLWKFSVGGEGGMDMTVIKIVITVVSLPVIAGIIYAMGED